MVNFTASGAGLGALFFSLDNGTTFTPLAVIEDPAGADGLCCTTLYVLPRAVGAYAAGTLLWSGSFGQAPPGNVTRSMTVRLWASHDDGVTWTFVSVIANTSTAYGLWEPELTVDSSGAVVCFYSDESDPAQHSQYLTQTRSIDLVAWSLPTPTVASPVQVLRPGMANVRTVACDGRVLYLMTYEVCNLPAQFSCQAHIRTSVDGWDWGNPGDIGTPIMLPDGAFLAHTPVLAALQQYGASTLPSIVVTAQMMLLGNGSQAPLSGGVVAILDDACADLRGVLWRTAAAPVYVPDPPNNYCPNYSPALLVLPSTAGTTLFETTTAYSGPVCQAYFNASALAAP